MGAQMKTFVTLGILMIAPMAFSKPVTTSDLQGYFLLRSTSGSSYQAQLHVNQDGTYSFRETQSDAMTTPEPGCLGTSTLRSSKFVGELDCSGLSTNANLITQEIDFSGIEIEDLEGPGAVVKFDSSAFETSGLAEVEEFLIQKRSEPAPNFDETSAVYSGFSGAIDGSTPKTPCAIEVSNVSSQPDQIPTNLDISVLLPNSEEGEVYTGRLHLVNGSTSQSQTYESRARARGVGAQLEVRGALIQSVTLDKIDELGEPLPSETLNCNIEVQVLD
jgi:hypothetical protein